MSFGGGDSLSQTIRLLIEVGGLSEGEALKSVISDLRQEQRQTAEAMRDAAAPANEMIKITASYERQINSMQKALNAYESETRKAGEATQEWADLQAKLGAMNAATTAATEANTAAVQANAKAVLDAAQSSSEAASDWDKLQAALKRMEQASADAAQEAARDSVTVTAASQKQYDAQVKGAALAADAQKAARKSVYELADSYELLDAVSSKATKGSTIYAAALHDGSESMGSMLDRTRRTVVATNQLSEVQDRSKRATAGATGAVLGLSRAFEDVSTCGFIGMLNNVPEVASGVGRALDLSTTAVAGWTAGISIAATGAYVLYRNWSSIQSALGAGIPRPALDATAELKRKLEEASKVTDELGKKTTLSLIELGKYREATEQVKSLNEQLKQRNELEGLFNTKSEAEQATATGFRKAVAESGGEMARDSLQSALFDQADAKGNVVNPVNRKVGSTRDVANELFAAAGQGDAEAVQAIREALKASYGEKTDFGQNLAKFDPAKAKAAKAAEKKKAEDEKVDELNRLGLENEAAGVREQKRQEAERLELTLKNQGAADDAAKKAAAKAGRDAAAAKAKADADARKRLGELDRRTKAENLEHFAAPIRNAAPDLTDEQVDHFAKQAQGAAKGGMSDQAAVQQILNRIYAMMVKQNAMMEAQQGWAGPWTAKLQQLEAYQQQVETMMRQNQQRAQVRRPPLGPGRGVR